MFLSCQWSVSIKAALTCKKETDPAKASIIRIIPDKHRGLGALCDLHHENEDIFFFFQKKKYIYNPDKKLFVKLKYPSDAGMTMGDFQKSRGLNESQAKTMTATYGMNRFDIPKPAFMELFKEHAVAPFFIFQIFCVALWCLDEYWYYSIFTLVMLVIFESTVVWQRLRTIGEFQAMSIKPFSVNVRRNGTWTTIMSDELLPGDLVSIVRTKEESGVPCDLVIVDGSCIVNEAMLSGESTPLLKEGVMLRDAEDVLELNGADKLNSLYGGTKVLQVTAPTSSLKAPDGGCICYVVRTGFGTAQGKLVRTMVYSTERVTANNLEALLFILFLLIFALVAAYYVWDIGSSQGRKGGKLLLDCILIITSVVPPELPMELSLAVNTSLIALARNHIFCVEPFRIPFAGKVDVCCFDKTGTLTGEDLVVEGICGIDAREPEVLVQPEEAPMSTRHVLATAHALVQLEEGLVGDPMERVTLEALKWKVGKHDNVYPENPYNKTEHMIIRRRFQFSSALKRMSTISTLTSPDFKTTKLFVAVKGAPETLKNMYTQIPKHYEEIYKQFTRRGSRVLALGYKYLPDGLNADQINNLTRDNVESQLIFAGFLVFHCPLKEDSVQAIEMLNESSHRCVMITGDNPLTACHVARQVDIVSRDVLIMDVREDGRGADDLVLRSIDETKTIDLDPTKPFDPTIFRDYDICVTGPAMAQYENKPSFSELVRHTWVYARVSPGQKETILTTLKAAGYTTLMCGDGTNDVGALKQAHIGVALLDGKPEDLVRIAEYNQIQRLKSVYENQIKFTARFNMEPPPPHARIAQYFPPEVIAAKREAAREAAGIGAVDENGRPAAPTKPKLDMESISNMMEDMDEDAPPSLKLGDASAAAPFTSKLSTPMSIVNIIRQGRCTLVATMQMYKILALNCLITAYSLSVLYLDGIKYGDFQVTITGILMAVCFMCISKATPLETLSKERPQPNIFNFYIILSVLGQFAVHIFSLIYITREAKLIETDREVDLEKTFEPGLLNSAIYLISLSMQVSTFAINYKGHPFRESLKENTYLYRGLLAVGGVAIAGATEFIPEFNEWLQLVPFPEDFKTKLMGIMAFDYFVAWGIELVCNKLFGNFAAKDIVRKNNGGLYDRMVPAFRLAFRPRTLRQSRALPATKLQRHQKRHRVMGSSASKAGNASSSGAKAAQRHFPSAAGLMNEKAKDASAAAATAAAAAVRARAATTGATTANTTPSSPKQDYLAKQQQLEEELQKLDEKLKDSDKRAGESRPVEDTPSAAQLQFFGNLNTIGQVNVPNPDQIKHHEAEEILRKKMPTKSLGGPAFTQSTPIISSSASTGSASSETKAATGSSASRQSNEVPPFTPLVLMQILQLRNRDPSIWTEARLSEEFGMARKDIMALTKYINTYTIVPGKDAKGRESGVWCEDIRKVETLEKPSSVTDAEAAAAEASGGNAAASRSSSMAKTAVPSSNSKEAKKSKTA
ncbi:hypothetical protein BGW38_001911 [Lunasporangiospora selenospora]|uniref:P-type ATPase A domain-containing protein n=1 Tax=Lunasporangiospora selenospora TaxID=979761 RepID=A0A9P6G185_9FUNG|nr:hypothetical protein BGW38_001911 [Lunasporangiospora selenospora]